MSESHYGFMDMHSRMDRHVAREESRDEPRRTNNRRDPNGRYAKSQHVPVTKGKRMRRGQPVAWPYGGRPNETIKRPANAKKRYRKRAETQRDKIGQQVARESSYAQKGCTLITVQPDQARAFAFKIRQALKSGQIKDVSPVEADSKLYRTRLTAVLAELDYATTHGTRLSIGVLTREECRIIAAQKLKSKHITTATRELDKILKTSNASKKRSGR